MKSAPSQTSQGTWSSTRPRRRSGIPCWERSPRRSHRSGSSDDIVFRGRSIRNWEVRHTRPQRNQPADVCSLLHRVGSGSAMRSALALPPASVARISDNRRLSVRGAISEISSLVALSHGVHRRPSAHHPDNGEIWEKHRVPRARGHEDAGTFTVAPPDWQRRCGMRPGGISASRC
jgi:hypothetical protein